VKLQPPAAGNQDFLPARWRAQDRNAAPAFAGLNRAEESRGAAPRTTASNLWTAVWGNGASRSPPVIITSLTAQSQLTSLSNRARASRVRRRAIHSKVCYDADRFGRLDIQASPCDSEDVNSFAEIVPGNTNFEVRSAGPDWLRLSACDSRPRRLHKVLPQEARREIDSRQLAVLFCILIIVGIYLVPNLRPRAVIRGGEFSYLRACIGKRGLATGEYLYSVESRSG